jgi:hypothetical protein
VNRDERLPPLTELVIDSIFVSGKHGRILVPDGFWNWTQIRHLELRGQGFHRFLVSIQGKISPLDTLIIEHFCFVTGFNGVATRDLEDFIISVRGLKNLKLLNHTRRLSISAFAHLGSTLEKLSILHPREAFTPGIRYSPAEPYLPEHLDE